MTNETPTPNDTKERTENAHPGMMGDGTEEQNLDQKSNPAARIKKKEADAAFGNQDSKK